MNTVYIMNIETKEVEVMTHDEKHKIISLGIHPGVVVLLWDDEFDVPQVRSIDTEKYYVSVD
jgi:hypothetical protein